MLARVRKARAFAMHVAMVADSFRHGIKMVISLHLDTQNRKKERRSCRAPPSRKALGGYYLHEPGRNFPGMSPAAHLNVNTWIGGVSAFVANTVAVA